MDFCIFFLFVCCLFSTTLLNVLEGDRNYLSVQAVTTSYLHMGAAVPTRDRDNKGSRQKVGPLVPEWTRPCPLILVHLKLFLSRTLGGLAGLAAGFLAGLLLGGEYGS